MGAAFARQLAFVWSILNVAKLSDVARDAIRSEPNTSFVSVASAWEISIKVGIGKWPEALDIVGEFEQIVDKSGFEILPISNSHVRTAGLMSAAHRDPFDRLLAAQAIIEGLTIVTADPKLAGPGAPRLW